MTLNNALLKNRESILDRWFELILNTYPQQTQEFVKREKDPFANPIGYTIKKGIEGIFDWLLQVDETNRVFTILEGIIKIKAVENISPQEAISFVFLLKQAIREKVKIEKFCKELLTFESKIDKLATISFDIFMKCKEKIYQLKNNKARMNFGR